MNTIEKTPQIEQILQEIDWLITEMSLIRNQVAALGRAPTQAGQSSREAEFFGMWADREDMQGQSSREWLERLRTQQWTRQ
jgi:hypothetical protein